MIVLLALVSALLLLFELVLIARVVLDWVGVLGVSSGRAAGAITGVRGVLHRVTEPVLAPVRRKLPPVRRKLPPVRLGGMSLDLSVTAVLGVLILVRSVLP